MSSSSPPIERGRVERKYATWRTQIRAADVIFRHACGWTAHGCDLPSLVSSRRTLSEKSKSIQTTLGLPKKPLSAGFIAYKTVTYSRPISISAHHLVTLGLPTREHEKRVHLGTKRPPQCNALGHELASPVICGRNTSPAVSHSSISIPHLLQTLPSIPHAIYI